MKATEIMMSSRNAEIATEQAEKDAVSIDQNWEKEATLYTFSDDSVLVSSGPQLNAFASMIEALESL